MHSERIVQKCTKLSICYSTDLQKLITSIIIISSDVFGIRMVGMGNYIYMSKIIIIRFYAYE
jgi:hypothetical protein